MKTDQKTKTIRTTSVFPAGKKEIFERLQEFDLLSEIAKPYISFHPVNNDTHFIWKEGQTFVFQSKLLGIIPFGTHTITVIKFDMDNGIYTNESNTYVPIWNHEITLKELSKNQTEYSDIVEIGAGWKTPFITAWATLFYRHRHKQWVRILG